MLTDLTIALHETIKDINQIDSILMIDLDQGCYGRASHQLGRIRELARKAVTLSDLIAKEAAHRADK